MKTKTTDTEIDDLKRSLAALTREKQKRVEKRVEEVPPTANKSSTPENPKHLPKGRIVQIICEDGGDTGLATARTMLAPEYAAASVLDSFGNKHFGEHYALRASIKTLKAQADRVNAGDMKQVEATLVSQAAALNLLFAEMARRASNNLGDYFDAGERYFKLALKAQNQCRMTLETLSNVKNPPMIYARQANVTTGPQQVNNTVNTTHAHAAENQISPNKILEQSHEKRMDPGTPGKTRKGNSQVEAMAALHGAENT